tara:strand:+ start:119825 stop:120817 length:993 start_codon:yes stop_codon:yes gene_type:complete
VFSARCLYLVSLAALAVACGPKKGAAPQVEKPEPQAEVKPPAAEPREATPAQEPQEEAIAVPTAAEPSPPRPMLRAVPSKQVFGGILGAPVADSPITVLLDVSSISGGLDKAEALRVLALGQDAFRDCSGEGGGNHTLNMSFRVSRKGKLSKAKVTGTEKPVGGCVAKVLERLVFADARKPTKVSATLKLQDSYRRPSHRHSYTYGVTSGPIVGTAGGTISGTSVQLSQFKSIGPLHSNVIRRVLRSNKLRMELCYKRRGPTQSLRGNTITLEFEINTDGSVGALTVKAPTISIEQCVRPIVNGTRFPSSPIGITRVTQSMSVPAPAKTP